MAYQALYRKWRPQTFAQVVGQTAIVKTLLRQVKTGHIAHAYLFCGCRGTGKTSLAKLMSRAINCEHPIEGDLCGTCDVCKALMSETSMDVVEVDAASNSRVEDMRELLEQVSYPPQVGRYKVYIIDEVHMLSASAFNALLKTLEEPPAHMVFILATTEPQKVPATILSRVQRYDFGRIPAELMMIRLREALDDLGMTAETEALQMVARAAEGALRDAFSILDMCVASAENNVITAQQVREILGTSDITFLSDFFDLLADRDEAGVLRMIDRMMRDGREPLVFLKELSRHTRSLITVQLLSKDASSVLEITSEEEKRFREQTAKFSRERLMNILTLFSQAESELRFASSPRIGLEVAVLRACEIQAGEDTSALIERIGELETIVSQLKDQIANGVVMPPKTAAPAKAVTPEPKVETKAEAAKGFPVAEGSQKVWSELLERLKKEASPLNAFLGKAKFIGESNGVYRVQLGKEAGFALKYLSDERNRAPIAAKLSEIAGRSLRFEAVSAEAASAVQDEKLNTIQQNLIDTFGRDTVQIEEGSKL